MSKFENPNDADPYLSQEALRDIRDELAKALILRGAPRTNEDTGVRPLAGEPLPRTFTYPLDEQVTEELFFPGGDIMARGAEAIYITPRELEAKPEGHTIYIDALGVLRNERMISVDRTEINRRIFIAENSDGTLAGYSTTEFSRAEMRVSPNDLLPQVYGEMTEDEIEELLGDLKELENELTPDDAEVLHRIAEYVMSHPQVD